jgi:hypothetical protein
MILRHVVLHPQVAEHALLGLIGSAHRRSPRIAYDASTNHREINSMKSRRNSTDC